MKKLWFKNKNYGYGWYPASWYGWVVLLVYVALAVWLITDFLPTATAPYERGAIPTSLWWYLGKVGALTLVLIVVARITGEKSEWRWGGKPINKDKRFE